MWKDKHHRCGNSHRSSPRVSSSSSKEEVYTNGKNCQTAPFVDKHWKFRPRKRRELLRGQTTPRSVHEQNWLLWYVHVLQNYNSAVTNLTWLYIVVWFPFPFVVAVQKCTARTEFWEGEPDYLDYGPATEDTPPLLKTFWHYVFLKVVKISRSTKVVCHF
jgi:hypothetical protein